MVPEQQPPGQTHPLQTPAAQVSLCGQAAHALPALPQALGAVPASQVVPLQQPAHDFESHTHWPAAHRWPAAQAAPDPHWQEPSAEQPSLVAAWQPEQMHAPAMQARPGGHAGPAPHADPRFA